MENVTLISHTEGADFNRVTHSGNIISFEIHTSCVKNKVMSSLQSVYGFQLEYPIEGGIRSYDNLKNDNILKYVYDNYC